MTTQIRRYSFAVALGLAAATMAFAQHLELGEAGRSHLQDVSYGDGRGVRVGERLDSGHVHVVSRPGLYGMSAPPDGSTYGVVDGRLIRFDSDTLQVQSIIRQVDYVLD